MTFRLAFAALVCSLCVTAIHVPPQKGIAQVEPLVRKEAKVASLLDVDARGQLTAGQQVNALKVSVALAADDKGALQLTEEVGAQLDEDDKGVTEALEAAKEALDADLLAEQGKQAEDEEEAARKGDQEYVKQAQHNFDCIYRNFQDCAWWNAICHAANIIPLAKNAVILINQISHCPNLQKEIDDFKDQKTTLEAQARAHGTEVARLQALSEKKLTDSLASAGLEASIAKHVTDIAEKTTALAAAKDLKAVQIKDSEELHARTVAGLVESIASVTATLATVNSALAVLEGKTASLLEFSEPSVDPAVTDPAGRFATTDPEELKRMIATAKAAINADIATHNTTVNSLASQLIENEQTIVNTATQMELLMTEHQAKTIVWEEAKLVNQDLQTRVTHAASVAAELQGHLNQTKSDGAAAVEYLDSLLNEKTELEKSKEEFVEAKIAAVQNHAIDAPALIASHDLIIKGIDDRIVELKTLKIVDEAALKAIKDAHGVL